jgi:MFS family permease
MCNLFQAILGGAAVFGMTTDLSLRVIVDPTTDPPTASTQRLSWASSIFYFGMLSGVLPLTYLFQRFHLGRTIGSVVILWGGCCMCTAAVTSFRGLYIARFFLGFLESIMPTAFMLIISSYYTQKEQTLRQCLWYSATGGWTILGALLNYGFAHITSGSLHKWQYLYLLAGSLTVLYGILFLFFPNTPSTFPLFHTPEETRIAIERLRSSHTGVRCQKIKPHQIREAILDPKTWLIALMMGLAYTVNGAVSAFGPLIVSTFGYTPYTALLWQMPLGGVCFLTILLCGFASLYIPNIRLIMIILCCCPVIAGCIMIWKSTWLPGAATPLAGYTLIGFFAPVTSLIVSVGMANTAGNTKKSFQASLIFIFYCVGNIVGPFWIKTQQVGRHYPMVWEGIIGCYCVLVGMAGVLWWMLRRENLRRERMGEGMDEKEGESRAWLDLTDRENEWFRYAY